MTSVGAGMTRDLPECGWDPSCNPVVGRDVAPDETPIRPPRSFEMSTATQPPTGGPESPTLTRPTNGPGSAVTAGQGHAQRMRESAGTQPFEALPHAHRCGARWAGSTTAHCGSCCKTFSGVGPFDAHRRNGTCLDPGSVGMSVLAGRAYECWGYPERVA